MISENNSESIFVEAESFDSLGGWIVETQSVRQMGSAYLMAHGMGVPVADAETTVDIPDDGVYFVWARTRNWVEEWAPGKFPGRFQILINGIPLSAELGTNGRNWAWQLAGRVNLTKGKHRLALHDLTGFNGRCDVIGFTQSEQPPELTERHVVSDIQTVSYDFIVVGGGVAGTCTALAAARSGVNTLCLQDRDILGGCNSSEVRVGMGGELGLDPYPELGQIVREIQPMLSNHNPHDAKYYEDDRKSIAFDLKTKYYGAQWGVPGVAAEVKFRQYVDTVEMKPGTNKIAAVIALDMRTGKRTRYCAKWFCDASGDAVVSRLAGCETMYGCEPRSRFHEACAPEKGIRQVMGMSIQWLSEEHPVESAFPDISDWALKMDETTGVYNLLGTWDQESGFFRDMADDTEAIRDYGLLAVYSNWHWMKNVSPRKAEFAKRAFSWISPIGGKRESYRVVGDYVFNQNDLHNQVVHHDGTAAATWNIDFHFPDPRYDGKFNEPIRSAAYHRGFGGRAVPVPYRCLYARDCGNLFLAGRIISVSHAAFACVRVMRTLGSLGEAVGLAVSVCQSHDCQPRDVYTEYLDEYIEKLKAGVPKLATFHPGGFAIGESYHFNSRGWTRIYPAVKGSLSEQVKAEIKSLGYTHMHEHPDLQDHQRRLVLADESRALVHYYDSFDFSAGFSIPVKKPVWDLKKIGSERYRIVCHGGFQVVDLNERKIVDEFLYNGFNDGMPTSCCDLPDGGFVFAVNPLGDEQGNAIHFYGFDSSRKLTRVMKLVGFSNSRTMEPGLNGEWLVSHSKGFVRIKFPEVGNEVELVKDYSLLDECGVFDAVPDPCGGYVAGCSYGGGLVRFSKDGSVKDRWFVPTDTGKESIFYAQVLPQADGHIYMAHWTGHGENDSFRGWQVVEFDENGKVIWFLDSPDRFGSISGISLMI